MARFYGGVVGNRGEATRLGSESSGMTGFIQGWNSGVKILASVDDEGNDVFQIVTTGGSNGGSQHEIARVVNGEVHISRHTATLAQRY